MVKNCHRQHANNNAYVVLTYDRQFLPLKLHLTTSELWFGQKQEGILPELLSSSSIV